MKRFPIHVLIPALILICCGCDNRSPAPVTPITSPDTAAVQEKTADSLSAAHKSLYIEWTTAFIRSCFQAEAPELGDMIIYRGPDSLRRWKSFCNPKRRDDKQVMERIIANVRMVADQAVKMEAGDVKVLEESEGKWIVVDMWFTDSTGHREGRTFGLLDVKGKTGVGDIRMITNGKTD